MPEAPEELGPEDLDTLVRMANEHGALTVTVARLANQVRSLRHAMRHVLAATDRYSDSRRAPWWLKANAALKGSRPSD